MDQLSRALQLLSDYDQSGSIDSFVPKETQRVGGEREEGGNAPAPSWRKNVITNLGAAPNGSAYSPMQSFHSFDRRSSRNSVDSKSLDYDDGDDGYLPSYALPCRVGRAEMQFKVSHWPSTLSYIAGKDGSFRLSPPITIISFFH